MKLNSICLVVVFLFYTVVSAYGFGGWRSRKRPPSTDAGPDQTLTEGEMATLDGSATTDPDSGIQKYYWEQISGPEVNLSNPEAVKVTFIVPKVTPDGSEMIFRLTATDSGGLEASDTCTVFISFTNKAPVADAGGNQEVTAGDTVRLDAGKSRDPDDGIDAYSWVQKSGVVVDLSSYSSATPSFSAPDVGREGDSLRFELTVTDNGGLSAKAYCDVKINYRNKPPTADAGADQVVPEGVTVRLDGTNSNDTADDSLVYEWLQTGGTAVELLNSETPAPSFTAPDVGPDGAALTFSLTVTDHAGATSSDACTVNIDFVNMVPVAEAGENQQVNEGDIVTLSGEASSDVDDGIVRWLWEQIAGPDVTLADPFDKRTSFIAPDIGEGGTELTFRLTVTDKGGLKSTDSCIVNVAFVNAPPVADAGVTQTVYEGSLTTLNAENSKDPDGNIQSFYWKQISGPQVKLSNPSSVRPTFTAPDTDVDGTILSFEVKVSDKPGLTSTDTCAVRVVFVNEAPFAEAGVSQTVYEGEKVVLDGTGSSDSDDGIDSYQWTKIAGPDVTISDETSANPFFTAPDVRSDGISLTFRLTVRDFSGLSSSDACIVNVIYINEPPVAEAGADQIVNEGATVTLTAVNSKDEDDGIRSYLWNQIQGTEVTFSDKTSVNPTFTAPATPIDGEVLRFQLTVTDSGGLESTDTCSVNITYVNKAPVAEAGTTQTVNEGSQVTLNAAESSDPDDGIGSYLWEKIAGPDVSLSDAASVSPTFTAPDTDGSGVALTFELTVTDKSGLQSKDAVIINVTNVNKAPVADAGADQIASEKTVVTLSAANSSDTDDGIISYNWTQLEGPTVSLSDSSAINPFFEAPETGGGNLVLTFRVIVTDAGGLEASDICTVSIQGATGTGDTEITLQWDTNNDADYYIVYWGKNSRDYTEQSGQILSPTTTYTISNLDTTNYYFAVKAFNECGNSSDFSDEITFNPTSQVNVAASGEGSTPTTGSDLLKTVPEGLLQEGEIAANGETATPVSPENLISFLSNKPSVEYLDSTLNHLEWVQIGWDEYNSLNGEARIAAGDIDGDGEDEIIIGFAQVTDNAGIPGGFFQILDHDFTHLAWGQVNWPEYNELNGETWPACGDLNDDGDDEIIIGLGKGGEGTIEVFDFESGELFHQEWVISNWADYNTLIGETRPSTGDIDGDGFDEIVVGYGSIDENNSMPNGYFEIIESDFSHAAWGGIGWTDYNRDNGETWLTCGDITGNGSYEIIAGLGKGGNGQVEIFEYQVNEAVHMGWFQIDWNEYNALNGESRPAAFDIDSDGKDEIILGLGPVSDDNLIPGGRYLVSDDDLSLLEWLKIDWDSYNSVNGETRPASAVIQDEQALLMGLGKK